VALKAFGSIFAEIEDTAAVVALHGWGRRGSDFSAALGGLGFVAPDLPGFGASPPPATAIGARGYAELLEPLLDSVNGKPVLVGHSFGGRIATVLAATTPHRFAGLVLTGAPVTRRAGTKPAWGFRVARWAHRHSLVSATVMERARQRYGSFDYRNSQGIMREILVKAVNESYEDLLPRVELPVVMLWGDDDREVPLEVAEKAVRLLPKAELVVVEYAGHYLPTSHPQELRRAVQSLLP
jgi:pimeloyl-ACP methyl ester carboxylesterase